MHRSNSASACVGAGLQVGAAQIEASHPGVQQAVRLGEHFDRLPRLAVLERDFTFEDSRQRLRLGLKLCTQPVGQFSRLGEFPASINVRAARNRIFTI